MNSANSHGAKLNDAIYNRRLKMKDLDEDLFGKSSFGKRLNKPSKSKVEEQANNQEEDQTILRGSILNSTYKSGFRIHTTDIIEVRDYEVTAILQPAITIIIMLTGAITFDRDDEETVLNANQGPVGYFMSRTHPIIWKRHIRKDQLIRKVVVTMDHSFVTKDLDIDVEAAQWQKIIADTSPKTWQPSSRILSIAERLIRPTEENPLVRNLAQQTAALEIMTDALQHILPIQHNGNLTSGNISKAVRIKSYVDQHIHEDMCMDKLATALGSSVNSLQRYFKAEYGRPLMGYIRERKLIMAHEAMERDNLTIGQAAYLAGYNSAANFSTAYKKTFGFSPSLLKSS